MSKEPLCIITHAKVPQNAIGAFGDWQARLNGVIYTFPHFVSIEISSDTPSVSRDEWNIVQRFSTPQALNDWIHSSEKASLIQDLKSLVGEENSSSVADVLSETGSTHECVTELLFSQVDKKNERVFQKWLSKVHQAEAKFPGFKGVYMQSPGKVEGGNMDLAFAIRYTT